jgi:hypothetical protein
MWWLGCYEYQKQEKKFLGSKARTVRKADNLTVIYEPIVWTMWDPQYLTTLYRPTVTRIALVFTIIVKKVVPVLI